MVAFRGRGARRLDRSIHPPKAVLRAELYRNLQPEDRVKVIQMLRKCYEQFTNNLQSTKSRCTIRANKGSVRGNRSSKNCLTAVRGHELCTSSHCVQVLVCRLPSPTAISVSPAERDEIRQEIVCNTLMWEAQNRA